MLFSVAMFPIGDGSSLRKPVAEVVDEFERAGLHYQVNASDTVIEGDWSTVMPVIQRAEERLRVTHDRVFTLVTIDDYVGVKTGRLHGAIEDLERELHRTVRH